MTINLWPTDAPYAKGASNEDIPAITPYIVESDSKTAAVIVCPGGGYVGRAEHEGDPIAKWLNTIGISAFVLRYRVAPYKHPAPMLDAQRAIRYIRAHSEEWNVDKTRVGILGFSAGGHLTATVGTHFDNGDAKSADPVEQESSRPDLMILCYPVISFDEGIMHQGSMINLLGEEPDEMLRNNLSNEKQATENTPPAFLWHTADDAGVPVENSMYFAAALSRHKVPFELHIYQNGEHGLGLAEDRPGVRSWTELCEVWLGKHGF